MELISKLWSDMVALRSMSAWLQWTSIALVFVSGFLQVAKFAIDRREKDLSSTAQAELINPIAQPVRIATATVDIVAESPDDVNTTFMDSGGYLAFGKGKDVLMVLSSTQSSARQTGHNAVNWRGVLNMDARDPSIGKPVRFLRNAEYLQIGFRQLKPRSHIKSGTIAVTINGAVRLDFPVPEQEMNENRIVVPLLPEYLKTLE
jgi:hypothetical protein